VSYPFFSGEPEDYGDPKSIRRREEIKQKGKKTQRTLDSRSRGEEGQIVESPIRIIHSGKKLFQHHVKRELDKREGSLGKKASERVTSQGKGHDEEH